VDFAAKVLADADAHPVKRVIVDLRGNSGGSSRIMWPLRNGLWERRHKLGKIYVLIGPQTFSSGLLNAQELHGTFHAPVIGEPSGEKVDSYGEVRTVTLANSKLKVQYTIKYFGSKGKSRGPLTPDILVPRTLSDSLSGRDAALEAALAAH